jgi:fatty acid desaturase
VGALIVPEARALRWHVLAMAVGECFVGFFAVWTVHRGCVPHNSHDPHNHIARTQRGWLKNFMTYSMLYHIEHHLFPAVPTCHLPELSRRLDRAAPRLAERQVF